MAKFYGPIGYAERVETVPGVWKDVVVERNYSGDVVRLRRRLQGTENLNDDINISNEISIVADPYACQNFSKIKYIVWMGTAWKVPSVSVEYPRLILTIGGVYNGVRPETTGTP